jgi:Glycosyl transferases group 1
MATQSGRPRTLILSLRNIFGPTLNRCAHYEFEDLICEIDSAELWAPELNPFGRRSSFATRVAYHAPVILNPGLSRLPITGPYDLFFTICAFPHDLIMFNAIGDLKDICKTSICLLDELWIKEMTKNRHFLSILSKFDAVLLYQTQGVKKLSERIGRRCLYFPPAVDSILFCPYPDRPERSIDVYSIGRRSSMTHQKLLDMARRNDFFYLYDSIRGHQAINWKEHRALFANVAKRSRYFIVNPAKIDDPHETGQQSEFGYRYFDGAAAGAIMIGERPSNEIFAELFDWPDAVIRLPWDSSQIDDLIKELDWDPDRQEEIRRTNVVQALLRHDWVYRWETILEIAGLEPMQATLQRKDRLRKLAASASSN